MTERRRGVLEDDMDIGKISADNNDCFRTQISASTTLIVSTVMALVMCDDGICYGRGDGSLRDRDSWSKPAANLQAEHGSHSLQLEREVADVVLITGNAIIDQTIGVIPSLGELRCSTAGSTATCCGMMPLASKQSLQRYSYTDNDVFHQRCVVFPFVPETLSLSDRRLSESMEETQDAAIATWVSRNGTSRQFAPATSTLSIVLQPLNNGSDFCRCSSSSHKRDGPDCD